jgi:hypothetical protein
MKLAGVDKSIIIREEREAVDAVRALRDVAGKLRAVVASVVKETGAASHTNTSSTAAASLFVPDITEQMPIHTLPPSAGGIIGLRPCALCGLKREERIAKIHDVGGPGPGGGMKVEDSFGEWWVEGAEMHLVCWRFWVEYAEGRLKGR